MAITGALVTMGIQIISSMLNLKYGKENTAKIKEEQRRFKQENQNKLIKRDHERFMRSCAFQLEIETNSHKTRLEDINNNFINSLTNLMHSQALISHYPLKISPYIIGKSIIPISCTDISNSRKEVFCILTNSNNTAFNKDVLPYIDELLSDIISTYWNQNSMHTMCYYPNTWNEKISFCDENIVNLKSILKTPTLTITPFFEVHGKKQELHIKLNFWGIGENKDISLQINTGFSFENNPQQYSLKEIHAIVDKVFSHIIYSMALNIDMYYWANYYQTPIFPTIVSKGLVKYNDDDILSIYNAYTELYRTFVLGSLENKNDINQESKTLIKDIVEINQFNFPKRCISFLDAITEIPAVIPILNSNSLIFDSIQSIYKAKTDSDIESLSNIDVKLLDKKDMDLVKDLISISKKYNNAILTKELIDIIKRKILVWDK